MIPTKKEMTEEDIKRLYITPAIESNWDKNLITMEERITDGRIDLKSRPIKREDPKKADYVLYINANNPIAVVEAKDNTFSVSHGMQQAITYARMLGVPFAYSSNGDAFVEHDFLTGEEKEIPLDQFPTKDELIARYKAGANDGQGLSEQEIAIIRQPYYSSQTTHAPRYYQRNAVNRTLGAIARGPESRR